MSRLKQIALKIKQNYNPYNDINSPYQNYKTLFDFKQIKRFILDKTLGGNKNFFLPDTIISSNSNKISLQNLEKYRCVHKWLRSKGVKCKHNEQIIYKFANIKNVNNIINKNIYITNTDIKEIIDETKTIFIKLTYDSKDCDDSTYKTYLFIHHNNENNKKQITDLQNNINTIVNQYNKKREFDYKIIILNKVNDIDINLHIESDHQQSIILNVTKYASVESFI